MAGYTPEHTLVQNTHEALIQAALAYNEAAKAHSRACGATIYMGVILDYDEMPLPHRCTGCSKCTCGGAG